MSKDLVSVGKRQPGGYLLRVAGLGKTTRFAGITEAEPLIQPGRNWPIR